MLWSILSGVFGATASSMIKLATSSSSTIDYDDILISDDDGVNATTTTSTTMPLMYVQHYICDRNTWLVDLDDTMLKLIHRIIGDLVIKYHWINLMPYWKTIKEQIQSIFATCFPFLFEVDYCQLVVIVPIRILCFVAMVVLNAYMIASFLRGIQDSGSVVGTALSTASNFITSVVLGAIVWKEHERMNQTWYIGFTCVLLGVFVLSNVQPEPQNDRSSSKNSKNQSNGNEVTTKKSHRPRPTVKATIETKANGKLDSIPRPKVSVRQTVQNMNNEQQQKARIAEVPSVPTTSPPPLNIQFRQRAADKAPTTTRSKSTNIDDEQDPSSKSTTKPQIIRKPTYKKPKNLKVVSSLEQYYNSSTNETSIIGRSSSSLPLQTPLIERGFLNECILCEGILFDTVTGTSVNDVAVADLSSCFHVVHSSCLKQASKSLNNKCPICTKPLSMFTTTKQAASCSGFWIPRIEQFLKDMNGNDDNQQQQCVPASTIRNYFQSQPESILTKDQKIYIEDDPSGMGKGLQAALEWGGCRDYNDDSLQRGRVGYEESLRSRGIWKYDSKKDDVWLWEWGDIHPRKRCDQCQLSTQPILVQCDKCMGSSQCAQYCSDVCAKRDRRRHHQTCQKWGCLNILQSK